MSPLPKLVFVLSLLLPCTTRSAFAQDCSPFPGRVLDVGWGAGAVLTVDFENDGDMDVLAAQRINGRIVVFTNDGTGALARTSELSFQDDPLSMSTGDFDGDQLTDVLVWEYGSSSDLSRLTLWLGTGVSSTLLFDATAIRTPSVAPAVADFDGDGDLDFAISSSPWAPWGAGLELWLNQGGGTFTAGPRLPLVGSNAYAIGIVAGDFDGDGDVDLSARVLNQGADVWTNQGGVFSGAVVTGPAGDTAGRIVAADFDADGTIDRAVLAQATAVKVFTANGSATIPVGPRARDLALGDADGDGDVDLFVLQDEVLTLLNQGGTFVPGPSTPTSPNANVLAASDLDGDGRADFAIACYTPETLCLHVGSGTQSYTPPPRIALYPLAAFAAADLDADGDADFIADRAGVGPDPILRNDGAGVVTQMTTLVGGFPVRAVDIDGDGACDVLSNGGTGIVFQRGTPTPFVFTFWGTLAIGNGPVLPTLHDFEIADVDGDGDLDIAIAVHVGSPAVPQFGFLLQNAGSFTLPVLTTASGTLLDLELGDVDGDHDLDVVLVTAGATSLWLVTNTGGGNFAAAVPVTPLLASAFQAELVDMDSDGDLDLVCPRNNPYALRVLANDGAGNFTLLDEHTLGRRPLRMIVTPLDDDGAPDVLLLDRGNLNATPSIAAVWRNRGDGTLQHAGDHSPGFIPSPLAMDTGDVDGDGRTDVLLGVNTESNPAFPSGIAALRNTGSCSTGTSVCAGDGSATACPCGNAGASGHGCANSVDPNGAELVASGRARVASDSLLLTATGLPPTAATHFLQSDVLENGGAGLVFGDGLLCVGGSIRRLALRNASAGVADLGAGTAQPSSIAQLGQLPPLGGTRVYQARYRNSAAFCTSATFNTTNALRVVWGD